MTITQTVDIPESHRITIDIPPEFPAGSKVNITFIPIPKGLTEEQEYINQNAERLNKEALDVLSYQHLDW